MNTKNIKIIAAIIFLCSSLSIFSQSYTSPYIKVISPNGGERWQANSTQTITWQSSGVVKVKIEYSLSGGLDWVTINNSVDASLGEYPWKVANAQTPYVLIRLSSTANPNIYDISDKEFSLFIKTVLKKSTIIRKTETLTSSIPVKIMPLGNSITWGVNVDDSLAEGYRRDLYLQLVAANYNVDFVGSLIGGVDTNFDRDNEGHSGAVAYPFPDYPSLYALSDHLNGWLTTYSPDVVLLHIGTNDVNQNYYQNNKNPTNTLYLPNSIKALIDIINSNDLSNNISTMTLLAKIIDRGDRHDSVVALNNALETQMVPGLPTGERKKVELVDMYTPIGVYSASNANYSSDHLHPSDAGYQIMADTWFAALQNYLPLLQLRVFLQGPYDAITTHQMSTAINSIIPSTSPYAQDPKHVTYTIPDSVTDWILLQFRPTKTSAASSSKSCFLSKNGYVIDPNNLTTNISLGTLVSPDTNYYVVVKHRNHLAIMSSDSLQLNGIITYDFTTDQTKAYTTGPNAMASFTDGKYGMYAGDANGDGQVTYNGPSNDKNSILSVVGLLTPNNIVSDDYSSNGKNDVNMDGTVTYNGPSNDKNKILEVVGLSTPNDIVETQVP